MSPETAAQLVERIYDVQDLILVDFFLEQSCFKQVKKPGSAPQKHLMAESRLASHKIQRTLQIVNCGI